jgi:hypothetical protein
MFLSSLTLIIIFVLEISLTCKVYVAVCGEYGIHFMTYEHADLIDITMKENILCKVKPYPSCHYICKTNIICI